MTLASSRAGGGWCCRRRQQSSWFWQWWLALLLGYGGDIFRSQIRTVFGCVFVFGWGKIFFSTRQTVSPDKNLNPKFSPNLNFPQTAIRNLSSPSPQNLSSGEPIHVKSPSCREPFPAVVSFPIANQCHRRRTPCEPRDPPPRASVNLPRANPNPLQPPHAYQEIHQHKPPRASVYLIHRHGATCLRLHGGVGWELGLTQQFNETLCPWFGDRERSRPHKGKVRDLAAVQLTYGEGRESVSEWVWGELLGFGSFFRWQCQKRGRERERKVSRMTDFF